MTARALIIGASIAALLTLTACDGGSEPPSVDPTGRIVFVGDSITAHWFMPDVANPTLAELVPGSIDDGVGGATSQELDSSFSGTVLPHDPSVVVIEAGTNDLIHRPTDTTTVYIQDMAKLAAQAGARVLVASVPQTSMPQYNVSADRIAAFNAELQTFCGEYGYTYVNYQAALQLPDGSQDAADFAPDGVHPNATGYAAMWAVLQPLLE